MKLGLPFIERPPMTPHGTTLQIPRVTFGATMEGNGGVYTKEQPLTAEVTNSHE